MKAVGFVLDWKRKLIMFWRERERETKEQNGGPPTGQIRVLVVGDSGNFMSSFFSILVFPYVIF